MTWQIECMLCKTRVPAPNSQVAPEDFALGLGWGKVRIEMRNNELSGLICPHCLFEFEK